MNYKIIRQLLATGALCIAVSAAQATVIGVSEIRITSSAPTWLQVAEVDAITDGGVNAAKASNGASTMDNGGGGFFRTSANAIDGNYSGAYPNIFHSSGDDATQFMTVILAGPSDIDTFEVWGRTDCCQGRDIYNVHFLDATGSTLHRLGQLVANTLVTLPDVGNGGGGNPVPAPAALALLCMALLGMRRRSTTR